MRKTRCQYVRLAEALQGLWAREGGHFITSMYAVVVEASPPNKTRGTDWYVNLKVVDPLSPDDLGPIELLIFGCQESVPCIAPPRGLPGAPCPVRDRYEARVGDILRLQHVKLTYFKGRPQMNLKVEYDKCQSWALFYQEPPEPHLEYLPFSQPFNRIEVVDEDVEELNRMRQALSIIPAATPHHLTCPPNPPPYPAFDAYHAALPVEACPHNPHRMLHPARGPHVLMAPLPPSCAVTAGTGDTHGAALCGGAATTTGTTPAAVAMQGHAAHQCTNPQHTDAPAGRPAPAAAPAAAPQSVCLSSSSAAPQQAGTHHTSTTPALHSLPAATPAGPASSVEMRPPAVQAPAAGQPFPTAAAGSVLTSLTRLPEALCAGKAQLVDMFAKVLACDERFVDTHGVRLLFLWDGTDIPALHTSLSTRPALPHKVALPLPRLPARCWALPLPVTPLCQAQGQQEQAGPQQQGAVHEAGPAGIHVMQQLPHVGTALPVLVPAAVAVASLPDAHQGAWIKIKHLSPFVHQGQVQALWLPSTRWSAVDTAKLPQVAQQAQERLGNPACTCLVLPPHLYTDVQPEAAAAPLVTLRHVLTVCPVQPVRVHARIAGHYPEDLNEAIIPHSRLPVLPPQDAAHGNVCMLKVRLVDATAELDAVLVGEHALKFFAGHVEWGDAGKAVHGIQQVLSQLETSPHAGCSLADATTRLACPKPKRLKTHESGGQPHGTHPVPVWGEFCLRGLVLDSSRRQESLSCRIIHTVATVHA